MKYKKIFLVVGARPNYMKAAPLLEALSKYPDIKTSFIHTGQHYDDFMSKVFFEDLDLPNPDVFLGIGSGTHAEQTARTMIQFEQMLVENTPDVVVVFGDINSTIAAALASAKLQIPVAHVEAGLRSFDRTMPEEINRLLTDHISDLLFTPSEHDTVHLQNEGIPAHMIHMVGNIMIDTLVKYMGKTQESPILSNLGLRDDGNIKQYALLTLHRPSNVDAPAVFRGILDALSEVSSRIPIVFPAHPRSLKRMEDFGLEDSVVFIPEKSERSTPIEPGRINVIPPQGYLNFLALTANASLVLTDSGGIQAETTFLGVPCLTLRSNTEWVITIEQGTNSLIGLDPKRIKSESLKILSFPPLQRTRLDLWDGKAAPRIARLLATAP